MQGVRLYYSFGNVNFGDQLSAYIVEKITGKKIIKARAGFDGKVVAIGSLLTSRVLLTRSYVWGTGTLTNHSIRRWPNKLFPINRYFRDLYSALAEQYKRKSIIYAVRGPLTRNQIVRFGFNCPGVYGDPGILLPLYYFPKVTKSESVGLVLHHRHEDSLADVAKELIEGMGIKLISIRRIGSQGIESFVNEICSCDRLFSSSLHGLITALAYKIPCRWIQLSSERIHEDENYKFYDCFAGLGLEQESPFILENFVESEISKLKFEIVKDRCVKTEVMERLISCFPEDAICEFAEDLC